ncbi:MAG: ABC transporter ATP-binding protein [Acidobacteria bacterium]|nr:ABC transporter ATP-binding protein [Acidobacteriota bacterium]
MAHLELQDLTQRFEGLTALDRLTLEVAPGEILTLLGPSGCGKTTTIRLIAGFLQPTAGKILVNGRDIGPIPPEKRNMGMVFQSYALFPHLNVFENVAFGLKARGIAGKVARSKVERALELVELSPHRKRPVFELSGGEQQRVAVARAVAIEPQILLLDEPLSNLDASLREQTRAQLDRLIRNLGITAIFVTHDQEEAFALSDRIALLWEGALQQVGTADQLYFRPANERVARFVGKSNLWDVTFREFSQDRGIFSLPSGAVLRLPRSTRDGELSRGARLRMLLRPENVTFVPTDDSLALGRARVLSRRFAGAGTEYLLEGGGLRVLASRTNSPAAAGYEVGEEVELYCDSRAVYVLPDEGE